MIEQIIDTIDRLGWGADYTIRKTIKRLKYSWENRQAYTYSSRHSLTRANRWSAVVCQPARA